MGVETKPTRYAHNEGHTDVCFSLDGSKIITCGSDGDIKIWSNFEDVDFVQTCVGEWALCVRQKGEHLYVATDNNDVQIIKFPSGDRDGVLMRSTAHISHIAVGKEHDMIAMVSEDMQVRLLNLSDKSQSLSFEGVQGPPLSVALSADAKLIAVSSGDGYLRVWDINSKMLLKEMKCVDKVNSFLNAKTLARMDFHPKQTSLMAYPHAEGVIILDTCDWSERSKFVHFSITVPYSVVQFSPCGNYLCAATANGQLVVWETETTAILGVTTINSSNAICALAWNPRGNGEIVFCDVNGGMGAAIASGNERVQEEEEAEEMERADDMDDDNDFLNHDAADDDDDENVISIEKLKRTVLGEEDDDDFRSERIEMSPPPRPSTPEKPLQPPFMPTSTPLHLNPRYLCWNDVGVVRSYGSADDDGDASCSIEVEFHDAAVHKSIMMQNYQGYSMAALSLTALAVANSSQLSVVPLNSSVKEWNIASNETEDIILIACSNNLICFATSNYLLRIFTAYGVQKAVLRIPGPAITMAAKDHHLLVAYHSAAPRKEDFCVNIMLLNLEGMKIKRKDIGSALGPESTLLWLGFSDLGNPAMEDSMGMLSMYPLKSDVWIPICDTSKHQAGLSDGFFVTALDESLQVVRGIRCKGSCYPGFIPRPIVSELSLQAPFVELTTEKAQLESNLFLWSHLKVDGIDKKFKETALKSFALACKSNMDHRAMELIEMLGNPQLLTLAIKYASKQNRRLAEKLTDIASSFTGDNEDLNYTDMSVSTPDVSFNRLTAKKLSNFRSHQKIKDRSLILEAKAKEKETPKENLEKETPKENNHSNETNSSHTQKTDSQALSSENIVNTQESLFSQESEPQNPFLKKGKHEQEYNPISLTDKNAGFENETEKEKNNKESVKGEKRKVAPADEEKRKEKQRKLFDSFMFKKS